MVKVFDAMMKRHVSGLSGMRISPMCAPSTLEQKCMRGPVRVYEAIAAALTTDHPQHTVAAVGSERIHHHHGSKVAATNANVDDVSHGLARVTHPCA